MIFGPCQETSYTAITLNPKSNFTRREKNHSLFHLNTLTSPELHIQTWVLCKKAASMIIGISKNEEMCLAKFTLLSDKPPEGYLWSRRRLTKRQATSRPDHLWPELWRGMSKNAKLREKHKWAIEKQKLNNARRLRGIYFIDPQEMEFKEIIKNARRKLETPMAPAMPCNKCKKNNHGETRSKTHDFTSKIACILEASTSTRLRMGESLPNHHEDHVAGKGDNSLQHYNLVHKFIPMPQAMKIPAAKAAVDKEWEKLEKIPAWDLTKVRNKKRGDR